MDGVSEEELKKVDNEALITTSLARLTYTVQIMNDVLLVLLSDAKKRGLEIPEWKTRDDVDKDVAESITKCVQLMKEVYGRDQNVNS